MIRYRDPDHDRKAKFDKGKILNKDSFPLAIAVPNKSEMQSGG